MMQRTAVVTKPIPDFMMEHPSPVFTRRQVSIGAGFHELGVSPEIVRRWLKSGCLRAERELRRKRPARLVRLPIALTEGRSQRDEVSHRNENQTTPDETTVSSPSAAPSPADLTAVVALLRQQAETIARLVTDLSETRSVSDRRAEQVIGQAESIAGLREDLGRLTAELETIAAEAMTAKIGERRLADELATMRAEQARITELLIRHAGTRMPEPIPRVVEESSVWRHQVWLSTLIATIAVSTVLLLVMMLE